MKNFLTNKQKLELKKLHKKTKTLREGDRIKTILLLDDGYSYEQISKILLLDDETIRRYFRIYQEKGIDKLLEDNYLGCVGKLSKTETKKIVEHLEQKVYQNAIDIVEYINKEFGIKYTAQGLVKFLHRIGFVYKKPKHVPCKANEELQRKFVDETYKKLKENLGEKDKIYFMDGTHPHYNSMPAYGWIKKGKDIDLPANTGRERLNINGAIDITNTDFIYREDESINALTTIELFKQIELKNPDANQIFVILDNAKVNHAKIVKEFLKTSTIKPIYLPPYSPNLNIIERLWLFFHKQVLYNKYYDSFGNFRLTCFNFFDNLKDQKDALQSLLTDNFHFISKPVFSQISGV